jgi:hypothetical protein
MESREEKSRLGTELYIPIHAYTELAVLFSRNFHVFQQINQKEQSRVVRELDKYQNYWFRFFREAHCSILK